MKRKVVKPTPTWLRGYRCHTLWEGEVCIGRIDLEVQGEQLVYKCQVGSLQAEADALLSAKRWVSDTARLEKVQLRLFS